jgi:hypothetical protein
MNLTRFYDFLYVIHNRRHPTKNYCFSKHIQVTTIYLLQQHKLKHKNYSRQKINMIYFVKATAHDMNMYAQIQYLNIYGSLGLISSKVGFLEFLNKEILRE